MNQIYSTATIRGVNGATANAVRGGISYNHNINSQWFYNVTNTDEYDTFQSLDFRFVLGGGLGYHAIKNERTTLDCWRDWITIASHIPPGCSATYWSSMPAMITVTRLPGSRR